MKWFAMVVVAFIPVCGEASNTRAAAEMDARVWLRSRGSQPNADELDELKAENPSAYAIVKALLVKQQLGLLDPRHPNKAIGAPAAPTVSDEDKASLAKMESEVKTRVAPEQALPETAAVYPEASALPAKHDWFNWKPTDSATSDDQMVSNVLGEVAALKGGTAPSLVTKHAEASVASVSASEASTTSVSVGASADHGASASVEKNAVARSLLASDNIFASSSGSSALASEGAALGFDTGDARSVTPVQQQTATATGDAAAPEVPKENKPFWGSLFDKVSQDMKPAVAHVAPSAVSQDVPVPTQRAQSLMGTPQQSVPANSYLSEYGLESAGSAAQRKPHSERPNPYLEMSGMNPSVPQSSLLSSRAKVQTVPDTNSNPYLKGLNLVG